MWFSMSVSKFYDVLDTSMWFWAVVLWFTRGAWVHVAVASPCPGFSTVGKSRLVVVAVQGAPVIAVSILHSLAPRGFVVG